MHQPLQMSICIFIWEAWKYPPGSQMPWQTMQYGEVHAPSLSLSSRLNNNNKKHWFSLSACSSFIIIVMGSCLLIKTIKQGSKQRPVNGQCPDWLWIWPVKLSSCRSCWPVKIQSYWKWNKFKVPAVQLFQLLFIESLCIADFWYEILVTCN